MHNVARTAALTVALMLVLAASAGAFEASVSPAGPISPASNGKVTFRFGELEIDCNFTLHGSLNSSIRSLETPEEQSVGRITGLDWRECAGGEWAGVLNTPWSITYTREAGTLPDQLTSMALLIHNFQIQLSVFGGFVNCLWAGDVPVAMLVAAARTPDTYISGAFDMIEAPFRKVSGSLCAESGRLSGRYTMSPAQTITVT